MPATTQLVRHAHSNPSHSTQLEQCYQSLRHNGLKRTLARKALLQLFTTGHKLLSASEIYDQLEVHGYDRATIYRNLLSLTKIGLLRSVHLAHGGVRYEITTGDHHHHITCLRCGEVQSIPDCGVDQLVMGLEQKGYVQVAHQLEFQGVCASCNQTA